MTHLKSITFSVLSLLVALLGFQQQTQATEDYPQFICYHGKADFMGIVDGNESCDVLHAAFIENHRDHPDGDPSNCYIWREELGSTDF